MRVRSEALIIVDFCSAHILMYTCAYKTNMAIYIAYGNIKKERAKERKEKKIISNDLYQS
jgi:hypothetical protein